MVALQEKHFKGAIKENIRSRGSTLETNIPLVDLL